MDAAMTLPIASGENVGFYAVHSDFYFLDFVGKHVLMLIIHRLGSLHL